MKRPFKDWAAFYQRLMLVFNGVIALSLFPFTWIFLELDRGDGGLTWLSGMLLHTFRVVGVLACGLIIFKNHIASRKSIAGINKDLSVMEKLTAFFMIKVRKFAVLEGVAIFAMIATYINSDYTFVVLYLFILFLFSMDRPRYDRVVEELGLSKEERKHLERAEDTDQ